MTMSEATHTSLSELFSTGQIRLAELSVHNWGSFHGLHTATFDPDGTLVTGDNGAGKSTLIDGHMALLNRPTQTTFNIAAAQGDRSDRTLMSYIRGNFGKAHDGTQTANLLKRDGATLTGLRALYQADDGSQITLAVLFWINQAGNALGDLKRFYLVGKRNLHLEELIREFNEGNLRRLKQYVEADPMLKHFDNSFTAYQEYYARLLRMENSNAPALLQRALGLKKIDDLTSLIRDLVLEPSKIREMAAGVVKEFDDLISIHAELITARQQRTVLEPLPELSEQFNTVREERQQVQAERAGLTAFFGEQGYRLWGLRSEQLDGALGELKAEETRLQELESQASERVDSLYQAYQMQGGERLESLRRELREAEQAYKSAASLARAYQMDARNLGLPDTLSIAVVRANLDKAQQVLSDLPAQKYEAQNAFGEARGALRPILEQIKALEEQIQEIERRPNSNIDPAFQKLRDELVGSLQLDKAGVVFIGELLDVRENEARWRGAIERALGGLRTTLLVPESQYRLVTGWLNGRHTGLHVRVQVVNRMERSAEFLGDGFLRKLEWKEHPYRDWLKQHLARFDLHCVDSADVLNDTPFSMTREGLVQMEKGRFEKKDKTPVDDRRNWYLGFNNTHRLAALKADGLALRADFDVARQREADARQALDTLTESESAWKRLSDTQWEKIDVTSAQTRQEALKADLDALERPDSDLTQAKIRWEAAKGEREAVRDAQKRNFHALGALERDIAQARQHRQAAGNAAQAGLEENVRASLNLRVGQLSLDDLERIDALEKQQRDYLSEAQSSVSNRETRLVGRITGVITTFKASWQLVANDWLPGVDGLPDYIDYLEHLDREGLPVLVERFQERLNTNTTQSLGRMQRAIDDEREDIQDRITTINEVLERTEFRHGTFLRLGIRNESYPHVKAFTDQLGQVLKHASSPDHEWRFQELRSLIEKLERATNSATASNLESLRLLDSRYRMAFFAEEVEKDTLRVRDVLESSSGKSGGEKESFAGIIVAASLAYVLTPDGSSHPVYCTVFLDEAFSNTAEAVSRRVLRVFRELKIHVNLITPYKNLNLARDSARSLLIAERDAERHESQLSQITWEELDRQRAARKAARQAKAAVDLGIEIESS
jgi:uncharacterized protein YPO0396